MYRQASDGWTLLAGDMPVAVSEVAVLRTNLISNPSMETNITGWFAGATLSRVTTDAVVGTACATVDAAVGDYVDFQVTSDLVATPNTAYTLSYHVKIPAGWTNSTRLYVYFLNDSNAVVGNAQEIISTATTTGWERRSLTFTTGPTTTKIRLFPIWTASPMDAPTSYFIDAVMLEQSASLGDYFDGGTTGLVEDAIWNGTAHASTVERESSGSLVVDVIPPLNWTA